MRWWIELQAFGVGRLALASVGLRVAVVTLTLAIPTAATGYFVVRPMLAQRDSLIHDQHQLTQQWRAGLRDVAAQRDELDTARDERAALLRRWQGDLAQAMSAVVASSITEDTLTITVDTDWRQWLGWLEALNDQPDVFVRLLEVEMSAVDDDEAEGYTQNSVPALRVTLTLTAVPGASLARSPWSAQALARDPFVRAEQAVVLKTPQDPLARLPLAELAVAGVIRHQGQWQVLVTSRDLPLQRRHLGAVLGIDGGVIIGIDHRKVTLRHHGDERAGQAPTQIELSVRREAIGDVRVRPNGRSES